MAGSIEGGVFAGADLLATPMAIWLVQAILVIALTRILAFLLHYVGQPRVIAEVLGGIILGPSVMGHWGNFEERIFPRSSLGPLGLVAGIGLVLYLFLVGVEMDPKTMLANVKKTSLVAAFGIGLPFAMGFGLAAYLYDRMISGVPGYESVNERSFAVFVCVAISITAFPVLARILNETNMLGTVVGATAIGAAALDDVTAWSLLALSIALIHAGDGGNMAVAAYIFLSVVAFAVGMLLLVRPVWCRLIQYTEKSESRAFQTFLMALTFLIIFFSAWVTEILGVHAIFGAFLFGLAMPRGHPFTLKISERIEDFVQLVLLPLFFTLSGLKTDIGELTSSDVTVLVVVVLTAIAAKFIGCSIGAKMTGLSWRESAAVGILMNTRGLVELIVLNIGLEAKVITDKLFTILVMMAILTTIMTTPLMHFAYPPHVRTYVGMEREKGRAPLVKGPDDVSVLMLVHHLEEIPALTSLLRMLQPCRKGALRITGAHLVESSIATTDILRARERARGSSSLTSDPSLQMLSMVGTMVGAKSVETDVLMGNPRSFAAEITRKGRDRFVDAIVIPHRQGIYFMADSYEHFLKEMVIKATTTVVLLVNPAASTHNILPVAGEKKEILVVVTGEGCDHEVLALARRFLLLPDVTVTLCVVEDEAVPFDDRVTAAVARFKQSFLAPTAQQPSPTGGNNGTGTTPPRLGKSGSSTLLLPAGTISASNPPSVANTLTPAAAAALGAAAANATTTTAADAGTTAAAGVSPAHSTASSAGAAAVPAGGVPSQLDSSASGNNNSILLSRSSSGGSGGIPAPTAGANVAGAVGAIIRQTSAAVLGATSTGGIGVSTAGAPVPATAAPMAGPPQPPRLTEIVLEGARASRKELRQIAMAKPYDFILVGHATAPLLPGAAQPKSTVKHGTWGPEHSGAAASPKAGSLPTTPKGGIVGGSFGRDGPASSLFGGGSGETPHRPRSEKRAAVEEVGVLGSVADALKDAEEIAASILVVHSAFQYADSALSLRIGNEAAAAAALAAAAAAKAAQQPGGAAPGSVVIDLGSSTTPTAGAKQRPALKSLELYDGPSLEKSTGATDAGGLAKVTDLEAGLRPIPPSGTHKD